MKDYLLAGLAALTIITPLASLAHAASEPEPEYYMVVRVIGHGCEGANGPLLAEEEDQLPICQYIEPISPYAVEIISTDADFIVAD